MRRLFPLHILLGLTALVAVACGAAPSESSGTQSAAIGERADAGNTDATVDPSQGARVRVVAANLSTGNHQSYDPGEGGRILTGLQPDVVLIQEFNFGSNSDDDIRGFVTGMFGDGFGYFREAGGQIPNGVISRYPIIASGSWRDTQTDTRGFAWARIDVPGDRDLWAVSLHLLTSGSSERQAEATAIVAQIQATIPATDFVVLGGDFNTGGRTEGCIRTFSQVLKTTGPFPADGNGNQNTSGSRSKPHDWVLADGDLAALEIPVVIGGVTFPNGLVFDSRVFRPLDAVAPVHSGDSGSSNMQHMAVVRDFAISP